MILRDKFEFDLTVKHFGNKRSTYGDPMYDKDTKQELLEELKFKSLSAVEVIRKLLDYIY